MKITLVTSASLALAIALTASCGRTGVVEPSPCAHTLCPDGYLCDPAEGTCKPLELIPGGDGGTGDGGATDGGNDGGLIDGGANDAGTDGGPIVPCANGCNPSQFCDETANGGAGACVTCTPLEGCSGATPVCDTSVSGGQCVGCLNDVDCVNPTPACNLATRTCVECTVDVQCGGLKPFCNATKNVCAQCTSNAQCMAPTPSCDPGTGTCHGCSTSADCANPTPVCQTMTQQCVPCAGSAQCGAGNVCSGGACLPVPDTCATAQTITFPAGGNTATFEANTTGTNDNEFGSCNPQGGRELVYKVSLTGTNDLSVTATRGGTGNANPAVYIRSGTCTGSQIACANNSNTTETATSKSLPPGDYFIFIESVGNSVGVMNVTVTVTPVAPPPPNDDCLGAQVLSFTNGTATVTGTTVSANNSNLANATTPTCSTSARQTGGDVVYEMTLTQAQDAVVTVTATGANPSYRPTVYVRGPSMMNACSSDTELGCTSVGNGAIVPQTLLLPNLAAGTYYVWVDSTLSTSGPFQLDVSLSSPTTNNTCATPTALAFTNGVATATGDTRFATNNNNTNDTSPTCSSSAKQNGKDVVYSYTTTTTRDVTITVTPTGMSPTLQPVVYVRAPQCGATTAPNELACTTNFSATPQTVTLYNQPAGTYFVWVDSAQQTSGPFAISVTLTAPTPPPANDTCSAPKVLALNVTTTGDTTTASDNYSRTSMPAYSFACTINNPLPFTGRDLVYQFTATGPQHTVTVTPSSTFDPALMVLQPMCGSGACTTWADAQGPGVTETLTINTVAGSTYFLVVDGYNAQQFGTFTIKVQ